MKLLCLIFVMALTCCLSTGAWAQGCSVCARSAAQGSTKGATGLNAGIIYLALLPLCIIGTVGLAWWRNQRKIQS